jgi:hypothetical protein
LGSDPPKACEFCGRSAREIKLTGEHVPDNWLRQVLSAFEWRTAWQHTVDAEGQQFEERLIIRSRRSTRSVCAQRWAAVDLSERDVPFASPPAYSLPPLRRAWEGTGGVARD